MFGRMKMKLEAEGGETMSKARVKLDEIIRKSPFKKLALAEMIGVSKQTFSNKMSGRQDFSIQEAFTIAKALNIPIEDIPSIFLP